MITQHDKLSDLARKAARANTRLLTAGDYLRSVKLPDKVASNLADARQAVASIERGLEALGADDPRREAMNRDRAAFGLSPMQETPLHLLSSEKAVAFAHAMRAAADACKAMEKERGIEDGLTEQLTDYADIFEMECFGPPGLGIE